MENSYFWHDSERALTAIWRRNTMQPILQKYVSIQDRKGTGRVNGEQVDVIEEDVTRWGCDDGSGDDFDMHE